MYIALQNCAPYTPPHPPLISFTCLCWIGIAFNLIVHANNDNKNAFFSSQFKQQNCKRCYALIAHAVVDFWVTDIGLMVTPKHKNIHTQEVSSVSLLSFFFSFQILIFPFIPSCPRRPEYISSSTVWSVWSVGSMEPPVWCDLSALSFWESQASGHSESFPPSAFVWEKRFGREREPSA